MACPSYDELLSMAEAFDLDVREQPLRNGLCGLYANDLRIIVVDATMPEYQKRCTLVHEMVHAAHGDSSCNPYGKNAEKRARRETALYLVDLVDYQSCEKVYGGDSCKIASELDVTKQVIDDFKMWLSEQPALWQSIVD